MFTIRFGNISVDIAASTEIYSEANVGGNAAPGTFDLLVNRLSIGSYTFDPIDSQQTFRRTLTGSTTVLSGINSIGIQITRPFESLSSAIDSDE
ncbi:hypothetical protein [Chamaesiphon sp. VAR_48_metabat_403]|uniref:hypothetical protein n=1 Tax=Chamaesiphon sp. VAR_48_metabat_403 TaxID=2964700 RepID=UPI00286E82E6|nr:hypothetical protein [Chamaesiphon sp. VAR_48_metabat_403]